jgi:hypothetical protein
VAKGLLKIPSTEDLMIAYDALVFARTSKRALSPEHLSAYSQWSRFDPRLAEILIEHFKLFWKQVSPLALQERLRLEPWPAALGVLLEFVSIHPDDSAVFDAWMQFVMTNCERGQQELFFIGLRALGGDLAFEDAVLSAWAYRRWGYLGREVLINKAGASHMATSSSRISPKARRHVIHQILEQSPRITVNDYMQKLDGRIERRQAERDLKAHPQLRAIGNTRGRYYVFK